MSSPSTCWSPKLRCPVSAYDEVGAFKLYLPDVGLLRRHAGLPASVVIRGGEFFRSSRGGHVTGRRTDKLIDLALARQ